MRVPYNANGSSADAVIKIPCPSTVSVVLCEMIAFSYASSPTNGRLLIQDGTVTGDTDGASVTLFDADITSGGIGPFVLNLCAPQGRGMNINLKNGGVVGKVNAISAG